MIERFIKTDHCYFYCLDSSGLIVEKISQVELSAIAPDYENLKDFVVAQDITTPNLVSVKDDDRLDFVMKEFSRENIDEIPVVSSEDPRKILGTIWIIDIISAYNKEILKRDLEGEVYDSMTRSAYSDLVEVMDGYYLLEIEVPNSFINKQVKEIAVRNKYGVDIILIRQKSQGEKLKTKIPQGKYTFHKDDHLLIFGALKKVEYLRNV